MPTRRRPSAGFTLLEVLMVVMVMAILAVLVIPNIQPNLCEQLQAAGEIVAADLAYGRSLAVTNNDRYKFTWDLTNNRYILQYSGSNSARSKLPSTPFRDTGNPVTQYVVDFDTLPAIGMPIMLAAAAVSSSAGVYTKTNTLEFGPLGGTTSTQPTTIWLSAGANAAARYITVVVNPVTGLATVGAFTNNGPPTMN